MTPVPGEVDKAHGVVLVVGDEQPRSGWTDRETSSNRLNDETHASRVAQLELGGLGEQPVAPREDVDRVIGPARDVEFLATWIPGDAIKGVGDGQHLSLLRVPIADVEDKHVLVRLVGDR